MANGFVHLLNRLKDLLETNKKDIESLKEHSQMLTDQFRQTSAEEISQTNDSSQTIIGAMDDLIYIRKHFAETGIR
jgi:hypothetical protein